MQGFYPVIPVSSPVPAASTSEYDAAKPRLRIIRVENEQDKQFPTSDGYTSVRRRQWGNGSSEETLDKRAKMPARAQRAKLFCNNFLQFSLTTIFSLPIK